MAAGASSAGRASNSAARKISTTLAAAARLRYGLYLPDTNVVSELRRARPHKGVASCIAATSSRFLHLSAVVVGELQAGIATCRGRDPARAAELEHRWLRSRVPGASCGWMAPLSE